MDMIRHASRGALVVALAICGLGCRSAPPPREAQLQQLSAEASALESILAQRDDAAPGVLRFALAFGAAADLDLFVTGPFQESVYFANSPSAIGGKLEADLGCDSPEPRVETVSFEDAPAGRYRVGIDFPERCDEADQAVPFAVSVLEGDEPLAGTRGVIRPREFLTIVLEVDVP